MMFVTTETLAASKQMQEALRQMAKQMELPSDLIRSKAETTAMEVQMRLQEHEAQMHPALRLTALQTRRSHLKARRQRIFHALLKMREVAPMPTLIVPKGSTRPEDWTVLPPEETPEETKARSLLADLTVELRRVLLQLAEISQMSELETARMVNREMSLWPQM
ncbi:hypothetical protein DXT94_15730 [Rhizobium sp. ICMP 5592]|nr:hypothetical protein [Rhizobium sp. ICMP 5592]